jgi:hypothetical protein
VEPLAEAVYRDGVLRLPYTREQVRNAPHQPADRRLTPDDELVLVGHYGTDHHASGHPTPDQRQE